MVVASQQFLDKFSPFSRIIKRLFGFQRYFRCCTRAGSPIKPKTFSRTIWIKKLYKVYWFWKRNRLCTFLVQSKKRGLAVGCTRRFPVSLSLHRTRWLIYKKIITINTIYTFKNQVTDRSYITFLVKNNCSYKSQIVSCLVAC